MEIGGFQKTVLLVAIGVLSVSLFGIAILLMKEKRKKVFPNEIGDCPDYFNQSLNQTGCETSKTYKELGGTKSEPPTIDGKACTNPGNIFITKSKFTGSNGRVEKCKWAKGCGLTWDGISNQNLC
ncbi:MAG: hypothetical protein CML42_08085 [Rhodobacteraceae bacterium]|nr:hypothetical protein [Paracoccaceae bacterium]|tara:strand:- start:88195 stop:88569 length:375 start_codon:yes stop_codon:yes gene_type:complete